MSGHSKWSTIKRKKGAADAARGKVFTKLAREIQVAARNGADINANFALRLAVDKAKTENMPKENIERAIRRGAGLEKDAAEIENITYEGYAPHGIAVLIECLTDNRNRTISELRRVFTHGGGGLGEPGSVAWQFQSKGYIVFEQNGDGNAQPKVDLDAIYMVALEAGAEDVIETDDLIEIFTDRVNFANVNQMLSEQEMRPTRAELLMQPNASLTLSQDQAREVLDLIQEVEDLDDVNNVYHNMEITEELLAQLA